MQQYLVTANDFTDAGALERRMTIRPDHLQGVKQIKENGNYIIGGAILNDDGKMIGSTMILQFETEEELKHWEAHEPYITQKVWETYQIKRFKVAGV